MAAATTAAALPAAPCFSSFCAFFVPSTLEGDRWCVALSVFLPPPAVGKTSVYWAAAEFPGGTTAPSPAAAEAAPMRIAANHNARQATGVFIRS